MKDDKVTIDADYFAELYRKANETDTICKECREEHTAEKFNALAKGRDELKAQLESNCKECVCRDEAKALAESLAAAERCIEDIARRTMFTTTNENIVIGITDIIRAYRAAKEEVK